MPLPPDNQSLWQKIAASPVVGVCLGVVLPPLWFVGFMLGGQLALFFFWIFLFLTIVYVGLQSN